MKTEAALLVHVVVVDVRAGHHHDRDALGGLVVLEPAADLVAVDLRQIRVELLERAAEPDRRVRKERQKRPRGELDRRFKDEPRQHARGALS